MNTFSTKRSLERKFRSFLKNMWTTTEVCLLSVVLVVLAGRIVFGGGFYFSAKEEVVITAGPIALLVLGYGITAGLVFNTVWEKYRTVMMSVLRGDRTAFLENRDERIPVVLYVLLGIFSFMLITLIGMLRFEHFGSWIVCEMSVAMVTSFFWVLTAKIDNPCTSSWLLERVDKEWLTADIDKEFFGDKAED